MNDVTDGTSSCGGNGSDAASNCTEIAQIDDVMMTSEHEDDDNDDEKVTMTTIPDRSSKQEVEEKVQCPITNSIVAVTATVEANNDVKITSSSVPPPPSSSLSPQQPSSSSSPQAPSSSSLICLTPSLGQQHSLVPSSNDLSTVSSLTDLSPKRTSATSIYFSSSSSSLSSSQATTHQQIFSPSNNTRTETSTRALTSTYDHRSSFLSNNNTDSIVVSNITGSNQRSYHQNSQTNGIVTNNFNIVNNNQIKNSISSSSSSGNNNFIINNNTLDHASNSSSNNNATINGTNNNNNSSSNNDELMLEVTCGQNSAYLYMSRLQLGSKGTCVYFDGSWLTPNEFQFVSGRETAKDWKRSIKHHGKSLKVLIAKGILTTSPLRCACGQCSGSSAGVSTGVPPLAGPQHLFGPPANVNSLLLQHHKSNTSVAHNSLQGKEKSNGLLTLDSKSYPSCCTNNDITTATSTGGNNLQHNQQHVFNVGNTANNNNNNNNNNSNVNNLLHHHHHHPLHHQHISLPYPSHHHHQIYAGGHTSHHFPKTGNGYFKIADDLMMMKTSFLSPGATVESPYGGYYAAGNAGCFTLQHGQSETQRSKQIDGSSSNRNNPDPDKDSKCSKDYISKVAGGESERNVDVVVTHQDNSKIDEDNNDSERIISAGNLYGNNNGDGNEKEKKQKRKPGNDVRCSVTTRDCGTSFERKHVTGSGKNAHRKSSASKDEKTTCQEPGDDNKSELQHLHNPHNTQQQSRGSHMNDDVKESSRFNSSEDKTYTGSSTSPEVTSTTPVIDNVKTTPSNSTTNNYTDSTAATSSTTPPVDHTQNHHENFSDDVEYRLRQQQQQQHQQFNNVRVPTLRDVMGFPDAFYPFFPCGFNSSPSCYPAMLPTYSPYYQNPYLFPMNLSIPTPSVAPAFPYAWPVTPGDSVSPSGLVLPSVPTARIDGNLSPTQPQIKNNDNNFKNDDSKIVGLSDKNNNNTTTTSVTTSNATPATATSSLFNFPWMKSQDSLPMSHPYGHSLLSSDSERIKRKPSAVSGDEKDPSLSPPSCKRFHGDAKSQALSGFAGCWPVSQFYYPPQFDIRSLMMPSFSACEISPCETTRPLFCSSSTHESPGFSKTDSYASLFPSLYSVPYLPGISTR